MSEENEQNNERERANRQAEGVLILGSFFMGVATVAVITSIWHVHKTTKDKVVNLCDEVEKLECKDKECTKIKELKKTCSDFKAGNGSDYRAMARKLSNGLGKSDAKPPKMKKPQRMLGPSVK